MVSQTNFYGILESLTLSTLILCEKTYYHSPENLRSGMKLGKNRRKVILDFENLPKSTFSVPTADTPPGMFSQSMDTELPARPDLYKKRREVMRNFLKFSVEIVCFNVLRCSRYSTLCPRHITPLTRNFWCTTTVAVDMNNRGARNCSPVYGMNFVFRVRTVISFSVFRQSMLVFVKLNAYLFASDLVEKTAERMCDKC